MTTIRSNNSISRIKQVNSRTSLNSKSREQIASKNPSSPFLKRDTDSSSLIHRNSSKKLKVMKDEVVSDDIHEIELLKNKLDKLPSKRVYYKNYENQKQNRINKHINKFLNLSDNNDNNAPLLNKLKIIRNCSLPFITLNNVDLSVLKNIHPIIDNPPSNGRNNLNSRHLSNSFDYLCLNFNKKKSVNNNNPSELKEIIQQSEECKDKLDESEDSELKQFLEDLKEHHKELYTNPEIKTNKHPEIEYKTVDQINDSLLELEHFLIESGLTPIKETKIFNFPGNNLGEIKKLDVETIPTTEANFTEKVNETYTTTMSKKRVSFSEHKTIIKYDKKGDVKEFYIFGEDDVMIKKIINTIRKISQKDKQQENIKSILVRKNEVNNSPSIQQINNIPEKKILNVSTNSRLKNVKSRFLDTNYNSKLKKPSISTPINKIGNSLSKNHSFIHIPKTNKFINKNINYINEIAEKKKNKEISLNLSKRSIKQDKMVKKSKSAICKKFTGNPTKFYSKIPPVVELETLKLDSTYINNYKSLTENMLLNNSTQTIHMNELLYSFKTDDNTIITDPMNFEIGENVSMMNIINNSMEESLTRKRFFPQKSCDSKSVTIIDNFYSN